MPGLLKIGALAAMLGAALLFVEPFSLVQRFSYVVDPRPEVSVLFIGNSRTFYHRMPDMVRRIADSAGHAHKLRIGMHAPGALSLAEHLAGQQVHDLLAQDWDHVVLQEQSSRQTGLSHWAPWQGDAGQLIGLVRARGATPAIYVTWRYSRQCEWLAEAQSLRMHKSIQDQHATLAAMTGVDLINVGQVWETVLAEEKDFSLYSDCTHSTVHGSYLAALTIFGTLLDGDVSATTYMPPGVAPHQADLLRAAVVRHKGKS
jgi:hypothetical protein